MAALRTNDIARAIYEASHGKGGAELSDVLKNTVEYLARNKLLGKKNQIMHALEKIIQEEEAILEAQITTRHPLSSKGKDEIEEFLKEKYRAKEVVLQESIDEELLGGVLIRVNDEIIDTSLKHQIGQLQEHLLQN